MMQQRSRDRALRQACVLGALAGMWVAGCQSAQVAQPPAPPPPARVSRRLVILGFDGIDPRRVDALVAAGKLPHCARLGAGGYRGELGTTNPPQSPVAWAAFATGAPAGEHGIFDFVRRDAQTYMPQVATTRVVHAHLDNDVVTLATAENLRHGEAFWDVIARRGVAVRTITVPYAYPPTGSGVRGLAGLGTPDIRGTNSSYTLLTTDVARVAGEPPAGGQNTLLRPHGEGQWQALVEGPIMPIDGSRRRPTAVVMVALAPGGALRVAAGDATQTLQMGQTGAYLTLDFAVSRSYRIRAKTRLTVRSVEPPLLYVEPLGIAPEAPYLPLSSPATYAQDLWQHIGPFKTVGWVDDTAALGSGAMDEEQFLREAHATMQWTQRAVLAALRDATDSLVVAVFTAPDRIAHMFYRATDAQHPAHAGSSRFAAAIDDSYVEMDAIIGAVAGILRPDDTLLVMSDHGFAAFRRGFNMNRWLLAHGYLTLKAGVRTPRDFFADVDWSRTRAYAFGTGGIYLNIRGREAHGSVDTAAAPALAQQLAQQLRGVRDGGVPVVAAAYLGDALYKGAQRRDAPDIRVALAAGYRASWATTLGGIPAAMFEDNQKKWSGDHASARPEDVPGFLLSTLPLVVTQPRIEDLAATAYQFYDVEPPASCAGTPLLKPSISQEGAEHATR